MIKNPIRGLGLDVDIYSSIGKSEEATVPYLRYRTFSFFFSFLYFFLSFRFSSVDGATAGGVLTIYFLLRIMYMGVHVSEVTRKGNSDVRVGERLYTYIYLYLPTCTCELAQTSFSWHYLVCKVPS